jgi:hypothetical protein
MFLLGITGTMRPPADLVASVDEIYDSLILVELKCIEDNNNASVDGKQVAYHISNEQWQILASRRCELLNEHADFFQFSQHPSAEPDLRELASQYAMPARLWLHGIDTFLKLLIRHLPASLEYTLSFINHAYLTLGMLYESVPNFRHIWAECLADLSRY